MDEHNFPSLNFSPQYLSNVTSWHEHLPFGYDLVSQARPSIIVELGVHLGDSYFNFCQSVKDHAVVCKCFGIDTWEGEKGVLFSSIRASLRIAKLIILFFIIIFD